MNTRRKKEHIAAGKKEVNRRKRRDKEKKRERYLGRNLASPRQRVSNICRRRYLSSQSLAEIHTLRDDSPVHAKRDRAHGRGTRACACAVREAVRTVVWYINHKRQ